MRLLSHFNQFYQSVIRQPCHCAVANIRQARGLDAKISHQAVWTEGDWLKEFSKHLHLGTEPGLFPVQQILLKDDGLSRDQRGKENFGDLV